MEKIAYEYILKEANIAYWELEVGSLNIKRGLKHDQIFGYSSILPDWSYENFLTHIFIEDRQRVIDAFDALYKNGFEYSIKFRIVRQDSLIRWVWAFARQFKDEEGNFSSIVGLLKDITEEHNLNAELEKIEAIFKQFAEHVNLAFYQLSDDGGQITFLSHAISKITGKPIEYFSNNILGWFDLIVPEDKDRVKQFYLQEKNKMHNNISIEYKIKRNDGVLRNVLDRSFSANDKNNRVVGILGIISDLTEVYIQKHIESVLLDVTNILRTKSSLTDLVVGVLHICCNGLNWDLGEVWLLDDKKENLYRLAAYSVNNEKIANEDNMQKNSGLFANILNYYDVICVHNNTSSLHQNYSNMVVIRLIHNQESIGIITFFVNGTVDLSPEVKTLLLNVSNQLCVYLKAHFESTEVFLISKYDSVTGLFNRNPMIESLRELISRRPVNSIVVIKVMVDQTNKINQNFGVEIFNVLLKKLTHHFTQNPHPNLHLVCSLENGNFAFILKNISNLEEIDKFALELLNINKNCFTINGNDIFVTLSVGVAVYPKDGENDRTLLKSAKSAVISAHNKGGNLIEYNSAELQAELFAQVNIEFALHRALERKEFVLHYQPKVDLRTGLLVGAEALIRWQDPDGVLHLPDYFIEIAENCDLILPIGEWVLREACRQIAEDPFGVPIAINLSIRQFKKQGYFLDFVKQTIYEFDINPEMLEFEVTESILMARQEILSDLRSFRSMGIKIAFDDFGTKYCSLNYLINYVPDRIKIDKSFVDGVPSSATNMAIITAIVSLAKALNIMLTVEGAEKEEQVKFFIKLGCDELQSWYISKAVPLTEFKKLLHINYKDRFDKLIN